VGEDRQWTSTVRFDLEHAIDDAFEESYSTSVPCFHNELGNRDFAMLSKENFDH
jgi:hypothetical protein